MCVAYHEHVKRGHLALCPELGSLQRLHGLDPADTFNSLYTSASACSTHLSTARPTNHARVCCGFNSFTNCGQYANSNSPFSTVARRSLNARRSARCAFSSCTCTSGSVSVWAPMRADLVRRRRRVGRGLVDAAPFGRVRRGCRLMPLAFFGVHAAFKVRRR